MSWETTRSEGPCFCGKGTRGVEYRSNDWGQSESSGFMHCDDCSRIYVWGPVAPHKPQRGDGWIKREPPQGGATG